jgi:hypothetical protein
MSARRILAKVNGTSKATKKAMVLGLIVVALGGFAACRALGDDGDSTGADLSSQDGLPLQYKPNLNLM